MSVYDQQIANAATTVDQCLSSTAPSFMPKDRPSVGFSQPPEPPREPASP